MVPANLGIYYETPCPVPNISLKRRLKDPLQVKFQLEILCFGLILTDLGPTLAHVLALFDTGRTDYQG